MKYYIPKEIYDYAYLTYNHYVPKQRYSGFLEKNAKQKRGDGDLIALLSALCIHNIFGENNKVCNLELTSGDGDKKDIAIRIKNKYRPINIKASAYSPFRDGLNLFVKAEELNKNVFGFIQCFVHLNENDDLDPHIHIPGGCSTSSKIWKEYSKNIINIPNTGGHKGIKIPCEELKPFENLINWTDNKF